MVIAKLSADTVLLNVMINILLWAENHATLTILMANSSVVWLAADYKHSIIFIQV